ncbi:MAG: hypothetical protein AUI83_20605 [Armatimonadetes bacterium 13_1_40CM_3_65_7]|nr:MAG: hypothetical protein AUI83_20605 [Armatimonadetes bacterium 13_1_40CM_3_65_7]
MPRVLALGRILLSVSLVLLAGSWITVPASPNPTVHATLSGFQETPLTLSTAGSGKFRAKISDAMIEYELSYSGLEGGDVLFAHIHLGLPAITGGVVAFLCSNSGGPAGTPACPTPSGTVTGTITADNIIGPAGQGIAAGEFAEAVRAILAGATYANVHTVARPGGEIRGKISGGEDD